MEDKTQILYQALYDKKLYSKSYDEFVNQFNTPEKIGALHAKLTEKQLYSKSLDEFNNQFFSVKKKVSPKELASQGRTILSSDSEEPAKPSSTEQSQSNLATPDLTLETPPFTKAGENIKTENKSAKTFGEWVQGGAKAFNEGLGRFFDALDYVQTSSQDALNQVFFGKEMSSEIKKAREDGVLAPALNQQRVFETLSEGINLTNKGVKPLPENIGGNILSGTMGVIPDILATVFVPEIKTGQILANAGIKSMSKFGMVLGSEQAIEGAKTAEQGSNLEKLSLPVYGAFQGYMNGWMFDNLGLMSSKLGGKIAEKVMPQMPKTAGEAVNKALVQHGAGTLTNAVFFGTYANIEEYLRTGEISAGTFAENAGMGLALGMRETGKLLWAKGITSLVSAPREVTKNVSNSDAKPEDLAKRAQDKIDAVEKGESTDKEGDVVMAFMLAKASQLKATVDEIKDNPKEVLDSVDESTLEPKAKEVIKDKINEVIADNDPKLEESKKYTDDIALLDEALQRIKDNKEWGDTRKEIESEPLRRKKAELQEKVREVYGKEEPKKEGETEKKEPPLSKDDKAKIDEVLKPKEEPVVGEPAKTEEIPQNTIENPISKEQTPQSDIVAPPEGNVAPQIEKTIIETPTKEQRGVKYGDKVYQSVEQLQDDYDLFPNFKEYNTVLDKVRKFEDGLREDAGKASAKLGKKIKVVSDDAELRIKDIPDKNKLSIKFFPVDISKANTALWKHISKVRDSATNWIAGKMQEGATSQSDALRWLTKTTTNLYGGLIRSQTDIMAKLKMSGTVKEFAPYEAREANKRLLDIVNSDPESLRRVRDVLDPEVATENLSYNDLTVQEQALHNELRELNTWIHETNYANGFIPTDTYLKFKNEDGSVNYIARMYDEYEVMPPEVGEFTKQGKSTTYKLHSDIYKQRKEIDDWKKEHAITDPVYLTTKRLLQTIQNGAIGEYISTIQQEHPNLIKDYNRGDAVPKGFTKLSSSYRWGDLRGKIVADHLVEDFTGFFYANEIINNIYDALKLFDRNKLNQFYKKWHTVYNPFVQFGNFTGNLFFSSIAGINPVVLMAEMPGAISDAKAGTPEYRALLKSGILGSTGITGDMTPITSQNKPVVSGVSKAQSQLGSAAKSVSDILTKADEATTKLYQETDNVAKFAAYKVFRKHGLTHEQAVRRVYDSFQNYSTVGKTWDLASKVPVFGNKFIKFQADLQRILLNGVTMNPMTTAGTLMMVSLLGTLLSRWSGESEEEKELRESRKGVAKIPFVNIPLSFKVGKKEINAARYFSPLYLYRYGDSDADLAELSKFMPIQLQKVEKPQLGESGYTVSFGDPLLGWIAQVAFDRDFRGNSIQNPQASKYFNPNPTTEERIANVMNYIARTQVPFYKSAQDMYDGMTGQLDYYGRKRTWSDAIINNIVKIQEFDNPELKNYIEGNIDYLTNRFAALSERMGNANSSFIREVRRAEEQGLSEDIKANVIKEQDDIRSKRLQKSLTEQAKVMEEIDRQVRVYQKWNPDDTYLQEHYLSLEAGKSKRFNVLNEVDLQRKHKEEYMLIKNNGLLRTPEIPSYYKGTKLTEEQKKQYSEIYWTNYMQYLDTYIGLTQEEIDEQKAKVVGKRKADTEAGEENITALEKKASLAAQKAAEKAKSQLNKLVKNQVK